MIFGADLSSYDGSDATVVDQYAFVILNVKDPGLAAKIARAKKQGIPWGIYTWISPNGGTNPIELARRSEYAHGAPPKGVWLDYEESGVTPQLLTQNLVAGEQAGMDIGVYTYLAIYPSVSTSLRGHPLWIAFYPHPNDGRYPRDSEQTARNTGAKIWQFSSSNGTRDLNVILDEAWWSEWTEGASAPVPEEKPRYEDDDMWVVEKRDGKPDQWWLQVPGDLVPLGQEEAYQLLLQNVPHIDMGTLRLVAHRENLRKAHAGKTP